jgi:hypothetical protein
MNILIIVLGCHIAYLLNDRIKTAVQLTSVLPNEKNIVWGFSGGIKNKIVDKVSEAEKMKKIVEKKIPFVYGSHSEWDYILDEESTNTAENFTMFRKILEKEPNKYSDIYVVTSDFHFDRAKRIADGVIENNGFHWVLSDLEYGNFREMEKVHLQNVENDIRVALQRRELVDSASLPPL